MTLIEHLYELRHRLGLAILAALVGAIIGFLWWSYGLGAVHSLSYLILKPYCALPAADRLTIGGGGGPSCKLLQLAPFDAFTVRIKVGVAAGLVLSSPAWLYQLWAFITPALHKKERKFAISFVVFATILFAIGALLAYIVVPEALRVLSGIGGGSFVLAFAGSEYISFMLSLLVIFGISFELPLLVVMLNRVGVVKYQKLKKWRRGIIFVLFVFAAIVTPGQDPISMISLAGALTVLFELSIQISRIHDRRKEQERIDNGWAGLADDELSPLDHTPEPVGPATPVDELERSGFDDAT
ncbi:MAG TPA: twin-arginine translocase subunit TatC [Pseudonocardiaceae bacterium]|jgi:sec-independent protein translocase protein TatC|nr:twin-arginine translocase subunit TatC [Pseudonocardiaceae bacterium]